MKIEAGMLCWIVKSRHHPEWLGRVVTTVEFRRNQRTRSVTTGLIDIKDVWRVAAPWLPTPSANSSGWWAFPPDDLRPITGPKVAADIRISDETEALDAEILAVKRAHLVGEI